VQRRDGDDAGVDGGGAVRLPSVGVGVDGAVQ
jgi:hypothetical protein